MSNYMKEYKVQLTIIEIAYGEILTDESKLSNKVKKAARRSRSQLQKIVKAAKEARKLILNHIQDKENEDG